MAPRRKRIAIAKPWMEGFFDREQTQRVFTKRELQSILAARREDWRLPVSLSYTAFVEYMCDKSYMKELVLPATDPKYKHKKLTRYTWRDPSHLEIGASLRGGCYLSHATAAFVHGLGDEAPKTVYVNKEQSPKPAPRGQLTQSGIDRAFSRRSKQRRSSLAYTDGVHSFVMLSGKNTGDAGVVEAQDPYGGNVRVTSIERTMIDIAVRPSYGGGVDRVTSIYRHAISRAQASRLVQLLRRINHVYPYHQAIGFYAMKAGFPPSFLSRIKQMGTDYDFYLTYGMVDPEYNSEWRIYYPQEL